MDGTFKLHIARTGQKPRWTAGSLAQSEHAIGVVSSAALSRYQSTSSKNKKQEDCEIVALIIKQKLWHLDDDHVHSDDMSVAR